MVRADLCRRRAMAGSRRRCCEPAAFACWSIISACATSPSEPRHAGISGGAGAGPRRASPTVKLSSLFRVSRMLAGFDDLDPFVGRAAEGLRRRAAASGDRIGRSSTCRRRPIYADLLAPLSRWLPDPADRARVLAHNPRRLFGFGGLDRWPMQSHETETAEGRAGRRRNDQLVSPRRLAKPGRARAPRRGLRSRRRQGRQARRGILHPERLSRRRCDVRRGGDRRARRRFAARDARRLGRGRRRARHRRPVPEAADADAGRVGGARPPGRGQVAAHGARELAVPAVVSRAEAMDRRGRAGRPRPRAHGDDHVRTAARRQRPPAAARTRALHAARRAADDRRGADPPPRRDALPLRRTARGRRARRAHGSRRASARRWRPSSWKRHPARRSR